ncbi:MAG TPA: hypothetical protein VFA12_20120 [Stellaceae bacterium]|nr:hypothetical protein [Stellaceae bacterium]
MTPEEGTPFTKEQLTIMAGALEKLPDHVMLVVEFLMKSLLDKNILSEADIAGWIEKLGTSTYPPAVTAVEKLKAFLVRTGFDRTA